MTCLLYLFGNHTLYLDVIIKFNVKFFRQIVQYALDHWSDYRSWRVNVCVDTEDTAPHSFPPGDQYSLNRLQVEVDQFFLRAAHQIISAHRYLTWQQHYIKIKIKLLCDNFGSQSFFLVIIQCRSQN